MGPLPDTFRLLGPDPSLTRLGEVFLPSCVSVSGTWTEALLGLGYIGALRESPFLVLGLSFLDRFLFTQFQCRWSECRLEFRVDSTVFTLSLSSVLDGRSGPPLARGHRSWLSLS